MNNLVPIRSFRDFRQFEEQCKISNIDPYTPNVVNNYYLYEMGVKVGERNIEERIYKKHNFDLIFILLLIILCILLSLRLL